MARRRRRGSPDDRRRVAPRTPANGHGAPRSEKPCAPAQRPTDGVERSRVRGRKLDPTAPPARLEPFEPETPPAAPRALDSRHAIALVGLAGVSGAAIIAAAVAATAELRWHSADPATAGLWVSAFCLIAGAVCARESRVRSDSIRTPAFPSRFVSCVLLATVSLAASGFVCIVAVETEPLRAWLIRRLALPPGLLLSILWVLPVCGLVAATGHWATMLRLVVRPGPSGASPAQALSRCGAVSLIGLAALGAGGLVAEHNVFSPAGRALAGASPCISAPLAGRSGREVLHTPALRIAAVRWAGAGPEAGEIDATHADLRGACWDVLIVCAADHPPAQTTRLVDRMTRALLPGGRFVLEPADADQSLTVALHQHLGPAAEYHELRVAERNGLYRAAILGPDVSSWLRQPLESAGSLASLSQRR